MMMFDMAPEVAGIFFQSAFSTGREMTIKAGIDHLCPGATIDETAFSPCGYSMNAILHDAYSTIHITPEPECSYASFETNTCLRSYSAMVRNVLSVFRPKRFVLTMFGDESALRSLPELPTDPRKIVVAGQGGFTRTSLSSSNVDTELCCLMACYTLTEGPSLSSTSSGLSLACASADGVDSKVEGAENRGGAAGIVMGTHGFGGSKEMIGQRERTFSLV
jgi:S-adenosylmethionine decarboxylase